MKKRTKLQITLLLGMLLIALSFGDKFFASEIDTLAEPPKVTFSMIPEFQMKPKIVHTVQPTALHAAEVYNYNNPSAKIGVKDVVKYLNPNASEEALPQLGVSFDQSLSFLKSKGYKYTKVAKFPNWKTIASELQAKRPVIAHLKAKTSYWLESDTSVIIWGIQAMEYSGGPTNVLYFFRSLNHADNVIYSGQEDNIDLLMNEKLKDPSLSSINYSWAETAYGLSK